MKTRISYFQADSTMSSPEGKLAQRLGPSIRQLREGTGNDNRLAMPLYEALTLIRKA
jgi:hypothetical protein